VSFPDLIRSGLDGRESILPLFLFRTGFGGACLAKVVLEGFRGYFHLYEPHTYLYFRLRVRHPRFRRYLPTGLQYQALLGLRALGAAALTLGLYPKVAAGLLVVAFGVELLVYFKYHTCFFLLLASALLVAPPLPSLPDLLRWSVAAGSLHPGLERVAAQKGDGFSQLLVVTTVTILYMATAYRKLNAQFLSGLVVWSVLRYTMQEEHRRRHFDGWYPGRLRNAVRDGSLLRSPVWRTSMVAVAVLEATLPFLLATRSTGPYAVVAGGAMHLAFAGLFPATLLPFSLATVSTYVLFLPPGLMSLPR
jgi:hypothetical protein